MDPDAIEPDENDHKLFEKIHELEDGARQIGLYLEEAGVLQHGETGQHAIFANFNIGKVAFSDRVQHPEKYTVDSEFKNIATDMARDDFLDARTKIAVALEKGEDPFASEDDE